MVEMEINLLQMKRLSIQNYEEVKQPLRIGFYREKISMRIIRKTFFKSFPLFWMVLLAVINQTAFSQDGGQTGRKWYCDERLKLDLRIGTVVEVVPYKKKSSEPVMGNFTQNDVKYKTVNIVKFEMIDLHKSEQNSERQEFFNVQTGNMKAAKFEVGQKYLFETNYFRAQPQSKSSDRYAFIQPKGFIKIFNDAQADVDFLKSVKNLNKYEEIFGTDEGESISAGIISGKMTQLIKPIYSEELKKAKVKESVNVMVLIGENGNVVKAKAVCAKNPVLATAAEQAALASKFSPTVKDGKPIKVKGVIVYNFNP